MAAGEQSNPGTGPNQEGDADFMMSLARGLAVMACFSEQGGPLTVARASALTGISRAAARRCLHTLTCLGYAAQEGATFVLRPKALSLGYAYLASSDLPALVQPLLDRISDDLHESCSLGVLEGDEVVYVGRSEAKRIMSIGLRVGSRLPLYCTSMGRVLLSALAIEEQKDYLRRAEIAQCTPKTVTDACDLLDILSKVREQGYAVVDQELEIGLRSVAVPITGRRGVIGAINIGVQSIRIELGEIRSRYLPVLQKASKDISLTLSSY